jgi:integrase/recombinase XerC
VSDNFQEILKAFTRHLTSERDLSSHTVRAYIGDLESLLAHLETLNVSEISQMELNHLRSDFTF